MSRCFGNLLVSIGIGLRMLQGSNFRCVGRWSAADPLLTYARSI